MIFISKNSRPVLASFAATNKGFIVVAIDHVVAGARKESEVIFHDNTKTRAFF